MKNIDDFTKSLFSSKFRCLYHQLTSFYFNRHFTPSATDEAVRPAVSSITQLFWLMKEEKGKWMF